MQNSRPYLPATLSDNRMPGGRLATCRPQVDEMRIFFLYKDVTKYVEWRVDMIGRCFFFVITLEKAH